MQDVIDSLYAFLCDPSNRDFCKAAADRVRILDPELSHDLLRLAMPPALERRLEDIPPGEQWEPPQVTKFSRSAHLDTRPRGLVFDGALDRLGVLIDKLDRWVDDDENPDVKKV